MTRASRATSRRGVTAAAPDLHRTTARKKKPYKIVLEAVTQEKRKLKSSVFLTSSNLTVNTADIATAHLS